MGSAEAQEDRWKGDGDGDADRSALANAVRLALVRLALRARVGDRLIRAVCHARRSYGSLSIRHGRAECPSSLTFGPRTQVPGRGGRKTRNTGTRLRRFPNRCPPPGCSKERVR